MGLKGEGMRCKIYFKERRPLGFSLVEGKAVKKWSRKKKIDYIKEDVKRFGTIIQVEIEK